MTLNIPYAKMNYILVILYNTEVRGFLPQIMQSKEEVRWLARSTIDKIREVEAETAEAEKKASEDARRLVSQTKEDAEKLIRDVELKALAEAEKLVKDAQAQQDALGDAKKKETQHLLQSLEKQAEGRMQKAADAIVSLIA